MQFVSIEDFEHAIAYFGPSEPGYHCIFVPFTLAVSSCRNSTLARYNGHTVVILAICTVGVLVRYVNTWQSAFTVSLSDLTEF